MPRGQLKNYKIDKQSYSITQLLDYEGVRVTQTHLPPWTEDMVVKKMDLFEIKDKLFT